jgi:iron-sulfur cluster insertion protein
MNITITESVIKKVSAIILEEGNPDLKLRIYVEGGGCSGFQYGFTLDEIKSDDDWEIITTPITVLIDGLSAQHLEGAEIDYVENLMGARFNIKNPNATATCGCGSSFSA